jgi:hypothetical protein
MDINPFISIIKNPFRAFLASSCLTLFSCFLNLLLTSFYISNTIILLKFCLGLIFWVILGTIPLLGIYFIFNLPFISMKIIELLQVPFETNILISFIFFILIISIFFIYSTYLLILLLKKCISASNFKVEYKNKTIIFLFISIILGVVFIFTSDLIFFPIYQAIIII